MERNEKIRRAFEAALAKVAPEALLDSRTLPALRAAVASKVGGSGALYYGTVDPLYYRVVGFAYPLALASGSNPTLADGSYSAALAKALAKRRNAGGRLARWDVLRASVASTTGGRIPSDSEVKALAARAGTDLDSSYTGRGTRVGAPGTYPVAPVETADDAS